MRRQEQRLVYREEESRGRILQGIENAMGGQCEFIYPYTIIRMYIYNIDV